MFDRRQLLQIISHQRNDLIALFVRAIMSGVSLIYRVVVAVRNWRFDHDQGSLIKKSEIPVISVGNLTTGGTGKTPMVIWLARYLRSLGMRVVIVSRGYQGSQQSGSSRNDEALEMEVRLPDVPHLQDPDRFRMTQIAMEELESEIVLLDDGFQHRQLHRDLDIVLLDATEPFGFDRLLPRGLLREPIGSLRRADVVVVTRCHLVDETSVARIESKVRSVNTDVPILKADTLARCWIQSDGTEVKIDDIDQPVFGFCGIGNPDGFRKTIDQLRVTIAGMQAFEDHHVYSRDDLESLLVAARDANARTMVCTHKDLVKIGVNRFKDLPIYALSIDLEMRSGEQQLKNSIESVVRQAKVSDFG